MKAQFISSLLSSPWNLNKLRARSILGHMVTTLMLNERPSQDVFGDPLPTMQIFGDVAVIPISGVVKINVPDWVKDWGLNITDANDIEQELDRALADPNVSFIVINSDSPGGSSLAGEKLYDLIAAADARKPVFGFCGDGADACSTAYLALAGSRAIYCGRYASGIGAIGSYMAYIDDTEYWLKLGIEFKVLRSGELKGLGDDALSPEQIAYLQAKVDQAGSNFRSRVLKRRTQIAPEDMEGQWFDGETAAQKGFVAGTVKDLSAAITKFRGLI